MSQSQPLLKFKFQFQARRYTFETSWTDTKAIGDMYLLTAAHSENTEILLESHSAMTKSSPFHAPNACVCLMKRQNKKQCGENIFYIYASRYHRLADKLYNLKSMTPTLFISPRGRLSLLHSSRSRSSQPLTLRSALFLLQCQQCQIG